MLSGIDHIVVLVRDLEQASRDYERLGFRVTPGGEHAGGETHNALIGFDDGVYFELIAFKQPERHHSHRWWPRLARGEGLVDYALSSDDVAAVRQEALQRGIELANPVQGARRRPDGREIAWRSLTSGREIGTSIVPFVIEDVTARDFRVPHGEQARHENRARRVAGVTLVTRDLVAAAQGMKALLGTDPARSTPGTGGERGLVFEVGSYWFEVIQPEAGSSPSGDEGLSPRDHLEKYGEGPYEVVLATGNSASPGEGRLLPLLDAHGARIRLAG
jgi:catechol 2,3-dioxygenase-like lactoylglutathione lyase family enzyme